MIPESDVSAYYARPDLAAVEAEQRALAAEAARAADRDGLLEIVGRWDKTRRRVDTMRNLASLAYHQDTRDAKAKAEEDFWNDASPLLRELDALHARTLLAAPADHREAIDAKLGAQFLRLKQCAASTFAPEIRESIAEEARLSSQYTELAARPEVEFRGQMLNMSGVARWFTDPDRATRLEAQQARDRFLDKYGRDLDALYDRLVKLRDGMGRALGHPNYTPLGYQLMNRTTYGPDEVARFRDEIRREVVPLAGEILAKRGARLGVGKMLFHDEPMGDPAGNPRPVGDARFCVEVSADMFRELGPAYEEFWRTMTGKRLLDLETRDAKAGGGFCTLFPELGVPFVFANFNGTEDDVRVLTHESGHAFQAWRSRVQPLLEYLFPTYEACEIHSMTMEYLAAPWWSRFFGGDGEAKRYERLHLESELLALPYMAAVDHFQHEVYASPSMTPAERNETWRRMESIYLPNRDYGGLLPYIEKGCYWQRQLHIFMAPFYYIDYALAQTCALQLWARALGDRSEGLRDYLALCDAGGSQDFTSLVKVGRLISPFEKGCLSTVVSRARNALGL